MPKAALYRIVHTANGTYLFHTPDALPQPTNDQNLANWLQTGNSLAFEGRNGRINLLKESRSATSESYWYGYRRQAGRVAKKYAGRSPDITLDRLEELALALNPPVLTTPVSSTPTLPKVVPQNFANVSLLLTPKLSLPRLHSDLVPRPRLLNELDSVLERRLTLLTAPAGYGKTTLVRQWLESRTKSAFLRSDRRSFPPVGWLSLDATDDDPGRFWRYFIAACQSLQAGLGEVTLAALQSAVRPPLEPQDWEAPLITLLNELSGLENGGLLVLEDFHNINSDYIYHTFEFFLDHLPPHFHLIIISRTLPNLPLVRWRAKNELGELGAAELRFLAGETQLFVEQNLQLTLSGEAVGWLDRKLEGWVAGLRLVALALRGRLNASEVASYFAKFEITSQRTVLEYFVKEVLSSQPPDLQDFLLRTSLLDRLTGPLCEVVTSRPDSESLLERLAAANLFLDICDQAGQWYRYHSLFAEAMQYEAKRRLGALTVQLILEKAAEWYAVQNRLEEAVELFLNAPNFARATELIELFLNTRLRGGLKPVENHTLRRWLEKLPATVLDSQPVLQLNYALSLLFTAMTSPSSNPAADKITQLLDAAEATFRQQENYPKLGEVMAFRSLMARQIGELQKVVIYAEQALEWLLPDEISWRSWSLGILGSAAFYAGDLATARSRLLAARKIGELEGNHVYLRANAGMLSGVYGLAGDMQQATFYIKTIFDEALAENDMDDVAHARSGLADIFYERNLLTESRQQAEQALELAGQFNDIDIEVNTTLTLAKIEMILGQPAAALERVVALHGRLHPQTSPLLYRLHFQVTVGLAWLYLQAGERALAEQWRQNLPQLLTADVPLVYQEQAEIMAARILLHNGQVAAAQNALHSLADVTQIHGRYRNLADVQLLQALAYVEVGEIEQALDLTAKVLKFARPQGYIRLFLDYGPAMEKLLALTTRRLTHEKATAAYLKTLLEAFKSPTSSEISSLSSQSGGPLSRQEEKVLRLLAAGQTNPQIASTLVVSVNTVRSQVQSIFRKLDVSDRQAAADAARKLNLI